MNPIKREGGIPFYYWFLAGLFLGLLMGWFFHGTINFILRMTLFLGVVIVIGLIIYLWQKSKSSSGIRAGQSDIPEGSWRNIDPSGRK